MSVVEPDELAAWLHANGKIPYDGTATRSGATRESCADDIVILDVVSTDNSPTKTVPSAKLVRMDAFDIYLYTKETASSSSCEQGSCGSENTTDCDSDCDSFSRSCASVREGLQNLDDDPSDSGIRAHQVAASRKSSATPSKTSRLPQMVYGNFNLRPADQLREALENLGITFTTRVIVLTQNFKAGVADPISAARAAWLLCYCGVKDVRILNGGFGAWKNAGYPFDNVLDAQIHSANTLLSNKEIKSVLNDITVYERRDFFHGLPGIKFPLHPEVCATTEEVESIVDEYKNGTTDKVIADVRSWDEYLGQSHGYNFDLGLGRIPGARWAHWGPSTYRGGDYTVPDDVGMLQPRDRIRTFWEAWKIMPSRKKTQSSIETEAGEMPTSKANTKESACVIFYCGSGWRSCMGWVMSQLLGMQNCKSYDGSFLEWNKLHPRACKHEVECGVPTDMPDA